MGATHGRVYISRLLCFVKSKNYTKCKNFAVLLSIHSFFYTVQRDFIADTIIRENNLTRHLISHCSIFVILNYSHENISRDRARCLVLHSRLLHFIWGDKDGGYGRTAAS